MASHLFKLSDPFRLSVRQAEWLFRFLQDDSGIPWKPIAEGCWDRAHIMCSFIQQAGGVPTKRWAISGARLRTPRGQSVTQPGLLPDIKGISPLGWSLHVAPTLWVEGANGLEQMVFDPVVCSSMGAVTVEVWENLLNDREAKFGESSARMYKPNCYAVEGRSLAFQRYEAGVSIEDAEYDDSLDKTVKSLRRFIESGGK